MSSAGAADATPPGSAPPVVDKQAYDQQWRDIWSGGLAPGEVCEGAGTGGVAGACC